MSKKEIKMFTVKCDNCGDEYQDDHSGFCGWTDFDGAWEYAQEEDWINEDDKHYCNECYTISDEDEIEINTSRTKI